MQLPDYFLPRPETTCDSATIAEFDRLYEQALASGAGAAIDYRLAAPKWEFLCYLADQRNVVMHGSAVPDIVEFEPRKADDISEFGDRRAVYGATDGIWPMFFAIVNRDRVHSLVNTCTWLLEAGKRSGPYYYFSIDAEGLSLDAWREGWVYLLPGDTFEPQPLQPYRGIQVEHAQWASPVPVRPAARLAVSPDDFPFLDQVRPHDPATLRKRALADPDGFPWIEES